MKIIPLWGREKKPAPTLIADLDALVSRPVSFQFMGKVFTIEPVSVEKYLIVTEALASLENMRHSPKGTHTVEDLLDRYEAIFTAVTDNLTRDDINGMTQMQLGALLNLIIETVTGKIHVDLATGEVKKKLS